MNAPVTSTASDQVLADALRANPNLIGLAQGMAQAERTRAQRYTAFLDTRPFVQQSWDTVTWIQGPLTPVAHLRHWLRAVECMTAIAGLSDSHALALAVFPDLDMVMGGGAEVQASTRRQVAANRAAALKSHPALAGLADLAAQRDAVVAAAQAIQTAQTAAAFPAHLLADLRARGVSLAVLDGVIVVPVGPAAAALNPSDRAAVVQHKAALVALLMAERGRPTVLVLA